MICLKYAQMQFYKLIYNSISRLVIEVVHLKSPLVPSLAVW